MLVDEAAQAVERLEEGRVVVVRQRPLALEQQVENHGDGDQGQGEAPSSRARIEPRRGRQADRGHASSSPPAIAVRIWRRSTTPTRRSPFEHADRLVRGGSHVHGRADDRVRRECRAIEGVGRGGLAHDPAQRQDVRLGHVPDEVGDVVVGRSADQLLGSAGLDDVAVAHDHDVVAQLEGLGQVVGDEHHRLADLIVEAQDLVLHVAPDQRIEGAERLIEEHDLGIHGEGAGQPDSLLHPTGELIRIAVRMAGEPDQIDHRVGPCVARRLLLAADLEGIADVVDDAPVRQQPEVLEDHRKAVPPELTKPLAVGGADVLPVEHDLAGGRFDQARQASDERRFAAAREAHDDKHLARVDVE